jgi:hypothetical protein
VAKQLLLNPVGALPGAYAQLGEQRALRIGAVLCIAFALAAAAGVSFGLGSLGGLMGSFGIGPRPNGLETFVKVAMGFLVFPTCLAAVSLGARRARGAAAPPAADVFTAGASLVPLGVALLLAGLIGVSNYQVAAFLVTTGVIYLVLMLYAGLTRVGGLSDQVAAPAVPIVLGLSGWLCQVIIGALS